MPASRRHGEPSAVVGTFGSPRHHAGAKSYRRGYRNQRPGKARAGAKTSRKPYPVPKMSTMTHTEVWRYPGTLDTQSAAEEGPPCGVGAALTPPGAEGGALRSQSVRRTDGPATLDGSVLRIDPATGAGVPGNPFYSSPDQPKFAVAVLARFSRERRRAALLRGSVPTDNHNACVVSYNAITRLRS